MTKTIICNQKAKIGQKSILKVGIMKVYILAKLHLQTFVKKCI